MGITKTEIYKSKHNEMAKMLKAIAHPARLAIIEYISQQDSCICGDIVEQLDLAQSTVSQHLKELKKVAIIKGDVGSKSPCYCLNEEVLIQYRTIFDQLFNIEVCKNQNC
ncbi:hypothetical protein UJ101_00586 [Flavobacteriaceae bacterium UJ101]|nr:hypothetical protein UJ101_00586 [Flavobacteriaceae bacterium UJ101]